MASLASFIGLPYAASYNASKAAVRVWGESIRYVLKKHGIGVSVICPGFVADPHNAEAPFPMPLPDDPAQASADHPARHGARPAAHRLPDRHQGRGMARRRPARALDGAAAGRLTT
jgi:short-subunit dehydrogenase